MKRSERKKKNRLKEILLIIGIVFIAFLVRETFVTVANYLGWAKEDVQREAKVVTAHYSDSTLTITTSDGMIITSNDYSPDIRQNDKVIITVFKSYDGEYSHRIEKK